ncbi:outer membrane protein [Mesorhizobium marinum]|uniref:Outer membrane protein n=1 Tax=Mesorhizobium marinum TaxID=3228790 RepID=A0ABV3R6F2_9HYPH
MHAFGRNTLVAVCLAAATGPGFAADLYEPVPVVPAVGGWYIRGHLGMSNQFFDQLESDLFDTADSFGWYDEGGFAAAPIAGAGFGYAFNDNLRGDLTVEWRGKSDFYALDWVDNGGGVTTNEYTATKSELVFMANGYYDIGNYYGFTPYVGAGIGASYNTISHFRDVNIINGGGAYADDNSEWNLAWALHAGLGFKATERMTIDFGYSFISLGDASTGELKNDDPSEPFPPAGNNGIQFNDIYSHDFKLGVRYALN